MDFSVQNNNLDKTDDSIDSQNKDNNTATIDDKELTEEESLPQTLEEFSPIHIKHGVINFSVRKILESSETFVPVDASQSFKFQGTNFLETGKSESESQVST